MPNTCKSSGLMFNTEYSISAEISQRLVTLRSNAQHAFYLRDSTCNGILSVKHKVAADG